MKTWRTWLATIALLLCCTTMNAHDFEVDGIYYNILSETDLTVEVTFKGDSYNSYSDDYTGEVVIPEKVTYNESTYSVTSIGNSAFDGCSGLTSITISNSVTSIGEGAFSYCNGLTSIIVDENNTTYDSRNNCNAIIETSSNELVVGCISTVIPNSVTSIGDIAFQGCSGITSITIPNSVTSIDIFAFHECSSLTSITIPNSVTSIGKSAFKGCSSLTDITIPNSVTSIGESAFSGCPLLSVENNIEYADTWAVDITDDSQISYNLRPNTTGLVENLFKECRNMTSINIPNSLLYIGDKAFYNCSNLISITIPNSVTKIEDYAFSGCSSLTDITIPNSVTSIGEGVFSGCSSLTTDITIPNSVTSIGESAFSGCSSLTSITIPNSVTSIGTSTFEKCSKLQHIDIPSSVTKIFHLAFGECSSLTNITIPNSVEEIKYNAFSFCTSLASIICKNPTPPICNLAFGDFLPTSCIIKVPAESVELYKKTSPWSNYNIQAISTEVNLTDNEDYTNATDTERNTITYTRTLPNLLWNALYLPFEIPVSQLVNNYDVAYFNDVHSYDNDNDGDIDNMEMEVIKITSGTLKANYPYLIRAKSEAAKELSITVENATLHKAEQTTISCSSVFMRFDITGTYASMTADELDGSLVITTEGKWQQLNTTSSLKPYRLYLTLTTLDGSPIKVENAMSANGYTVSIRVKGEGATGIESEEINIESAETDAPIYNLMGQPVQHPVKGHIYIKGGRKVVY